MKIKMTPDEFFVEFSKVCYLKPFAKLAGMNYNVMIQRIRHDAPRGSVARFRIKHMPALNSALATLADKVSAMHIYFNPYANTKKGKKVGVHVLPQFREIGEWVHIKSITMEALGWNELRYNNIISISSSRIYGHITAEDCDRINEALKKVAEFLGSVELVAEDDEQQP